MTKLQTLGRIVRLQIQRGPLKCGEKPNRYYDPAPILAVDELTLTPSGALARLPDGPTLLDIHHAEHPQTRNNAGGNDLSVGFTSHYAAMRARYGGHLADGIAGENILVEAAGPVDLAAIAGGLAVRLAGGGALLWLRGVRVAPPCREFSTFAACSAEPETIKAALQFLDGGTRGFCCAFDGPGQARISIGDEILASAAAPPPH